jgi:hypothetical protein
MKKKTRPSLRQAINDQCKSCVYDKLAEGTWFNQIKNCQGYSCPLYPVRPLPNTVEKQAVTPPKTDLEDE